METRKKVFNELIEAVEFEAVNLKEVFLDKATSIEVADYQPVLKSDKFNELFKFLMLNFNDMDLDSDIDLVADLVNQEFEIDSPELVEYAKNILQDLYDVNELLLNYLDENGLLYELIEYLDISYDAVLGIDFEAYLTDILDIDNIRVNDLNFDLTYCIKNPDEATKEFERLQSDLEYDYFDYLYDSCDTVDIIDYLTTYDYYEDILNFMLKQSISEIELSRALIDTLGYYINFELMKDNYIKANDLMTYSSYLNEYGNYHIYNNTDLIEVFKKVMIYFIDNDGNVIETMRKVISLSLPENTAVGAKIEGNMIKRRAERLVLDDLHLRRIEADIFSDKRLTLLDVKKYNNYNHFEIRSIHDNSFVYQAGDILPVEQFSYELKECASGIHFFLDKRGAENY